MTDAANPLLNDWDTPFALPPFSDIEDDHFGPAIEAALAEGRENIAAIADNPEPPTFANTIEALELADETLDRVLGVFFNLSGSDSNPARERIAAGLRAEAGLFLGDHQQREAFRADRGAVGASGAPRPRRRADAGAVPDAPEFRAGGRGAGGRCARPADRGQEPAGGAGHVSSRRTCWPMSGTGSWSWRRRSGGVAGLRRPRRGRRGGEGRRRAGGDAVAVADRAVPAILAAPRPAREGLKAWAARGANGGETDNRAIAAEILALRDERAKLLGYEISRLQAGNRDGQDADRGARPADGGLGAGEGRAEADADGADRDDARRRRQRPAGAVGLALLRGEAAQGASTISTRRS
jgi:peptidyl-dipeptidase Dcp